MATLTLGRRDAAAIRRLLREAGHGAVVVRRTMDGREVRAIAWLLRDAAHDGALPAGTRQRAGDWSGRLEARLG